MIRALVAACLRGRILVIAIAAIVLVAGYRAARSTPVDAFPEIAPPLVEVQTEAPGLTSLEVEALVTTPLENVLAGTAFVTTIRSKSVLGLSSIVLLFARDTDLLVARQLVQERLAAAASSLPVSARFPTLMPPLSSTSRVLKVGLTSATLSQTELSDIVRWTLRPRLLAVPGVANVAVWGTRQRRYEVAFDPVLLDAASLSTDELVRVVREATTPISGGLVDSPLQRLPVRHQSLVQAPADLEDLAVSTRGGARLAVRDVATVVDGFPQPIGDAVVNDEPGLLLIVQKQPWGNTLEVTRGVDAVLETLGPAMPEVVIDAGIFRPAQFIERSVGNLEHAMLVGSLFVVLVLIVFSWSWRSAVISLVALPLSLAAACLVLSRLGGTINTMVLAGLVIALGEVVDDAIIDVENILRRLRENATLATPRPIIEVALAASLEVRSAVVYATLIVVLVFLPVWFLEGVSGAFFRPLAMAYGLCVLASMLVALTVTPALSVMLLPRAAAEPKESPVMRWLGKTYAKWLPRILGAPRRVLAGVVALSLVAVAGFATLDDAFLPEFRENDFLMHWVAEPGTSLDAVSRTAQRVSKELRAIPGVTSFGSHIGRAEAGDEIVGQNFAELWVHVDPTADHEHASHAIASTIERYPGLRRDVATYLRERIEEVVSGAGGAIVVRLMGPTFEGLRESADAIAAEIRGLPGVGSVQVERQGVVPELLVTPRPEAAALGFNAGDIRRAVSLLVRGEIVGEIFRDSRAIPIVVRGLDDYRRDVLALRGALVTSASGGRARLGDVATVAVSPTPGTIQHEASTRRLDVAVRVTSNLGKVHTAIADLARRVELPPGHYVQVLGEWQERSNAQRRLLGLSVVSLLLVVLVLYFDLGSSRRALLVAASLPFALVGGVAGAWLAGGVLSLGSLVGLVTVLGIAARNGILLVAHYRQLESEGVGDVVVRGSIERIGPITMTALATALALVPLVVAGDRPGHEIEHPMALVILGGLVSSTLLNLVVMPVLYARFGRAA